MLYSLQALRAIGAGMVFLFHAQVLRFGYIGVDIFFVLSGFIIFWVHFHHLSKENLTTFISEINNFSQKSKQFSQKNSQKTSVFLSYFYRRCIRIYPTYWVFCGGFLFAIWIRGGLLSDFYMFNWWAFWQTFFLTPLHPTFLVVSWTLSYELYFYLLVGLLFISFRGINIGFWAIFFVFLGSFTNFLNSFFLIKIIHFEQYEWLNFLFSDIILEFYLGILIFYVVHFDRVFGFGRVFISKYSFPVWCLGVVFMLVLCNPSAFTRQRELYAGLPAFWVILVCVLLETDTRMIIQKPYFFGGFNISTKTLIKILKKGIIFFKKNAVGVFLGNLLIRLGGASYLLYISHSLLMGTFTALFRRVQLFFDIQGIIWVNVFYTLQIVLIQVLVLYASEWIEQPFLRKISPQTPKSGH